MNVFRTRLSARNLPAARAITSNRVIEFSIILSLLVSVQALAGTQAPTIRLFPTTVVEDLRQTSAVAKEMESGLQEVIGRLDQQQQLYQESKCDGAEDDPGCQLAGTLSQATAAAKVKPAKSAIAIPVMDLMAFALSVLDSACHNY